MAAVEGSRAAEVIYKSDEAKLIRMSSMEHRGVPRHVTFALQPERTALRSTVLPHAESVHAVRLHAITRSLVHEPPPPVRGLPPARESDRPAGFGGEWHGEAHERVSSLFAQLRVGR